MRYTNQRMYFTIPFLQDQELKFQDQARVAPASSPRPRHEDNNNGGTLASVDPWMWPKGRNPLGELVGN